MKFTDTNLGLLSFKSGVGVQNSAKVGLGL